MPYSNRGVYLGQHHLPLHPVVQVKETLLEALNRVWMQLKPVVGRSHLQKGQKLKRPKGALE